MMKLNYKVTWSEEDEAYVATVDGDRFQSLSFVANTPSPALFGLRMLMIEEGIED